ncbi:MAG: protein kinase [Myxococcota bacterium]
MASSPSQENRVPTQTFLLPGQQFCVGLPWERAELPKHGLPAAKPKPAPVKGTTLDDEDALEGDPCAGWEIGRCEIIRRLSPGSARRLLAVRHDDDGSAAVVDVRKLELVDALAPEIEVLAAAAAKYAHPHLARVYPAEATEEGLFWVSERVSGASLSELASECRARGKGLPLGLALSSVVESAQALGALHERGHGHGLLSDQAVAVGFDGLTKVLDVGLFRCLARRASWAEVLELTGPYLSPEQVLRGHMPDPKCDVFSLGILLYEGLTGEKVRRTERFEDRVKMHERAQLAPPSSLNVMVSRDVDAVVLRALEPDRARRFASGPELAQALREAAGQFMWRADKRADFVGELFDTRRRRERALTAHLAKPRPRPPSLPALRRVAVETPQVQVKPAVRPLAAPVKPLAAAKKPEKKSKKKAASPSRRAEVVALSVGLVVAAVVAATPWSAAVEAATHRLEPRTTALPVKPAVQEVLVDVAPVMSVDPPAGPAASLPVSWALAASLEDAPTVAEPVKAPVAVKKKAARPAKRAKKKDDAPPPPWLSGR